MNWKALVAESVRELKIGLTHQVGFYGAEITVIIADRFTKGTDG